MNLPRVLSFLRGARHATGGAGDEAARVVLPVRLGVQQTSRKRATSVNIVGFDQALLWVTVALLLAY